MSKAPDNELVSNRRARFDFEILETYEAGIQLCGTEVKSLRAHGGSLQESYVRVLDDELWLIGANIAQYSFGNIHNHEPARDRKLLMHKREIRRLHDTVKQKGLTLLALGMYVKKGYVKVCIALAKGKKIHDKRDAIKERDVQREMRRMKG